MVLFIMDRQEKMREVFKWAVRKSGFGQIKLAVILGCSQPNVSQLVRGYHDIKDGYFEKLAEAMETDISSLVSGYENDPFKESPLPAAVPKSNGNMINLVEQHKSLIEKFQQKELALEINHILLEIERGDPGELIRAKDVLKAFMPKKETNRREPQSPAAKSSGS